MSDVEIALEFLKALFGLPAIIGAVATVIVFMAGVKRPTVAIFVGFFVAIGIAGIQTGVF